MCEGPAEHDWWLDAGPYALPLPLGWTAAVTGDVNPAFYLVQDSDRSVFVQTARNRPTIEALVAPAQTVVDRGADEHAEWTELAYLHDGQRWLQRHALMRVALPVLVTAQAPAHAFDEARTLQMMLVRRVACDV